jgi:hypothetical protein
MAYKRTTKKTGPNTRKSTTISDTGNQTLSTSTKAGGTRFTNTIKNGKSYTMQTTRSTNGLVTRKKIGSTPKSNDGGGMGVVILFIIVGLIISVFAGN